MKALYYDAFAGLSGDMFLGAMIDLGVDESWLLAELSKLGLKDAYTLTVEKAEKNGIYGTKVTVSETHQGTEHHHHRHYSDILKIIHESNLSERVKALAIDIFDHIATAEGKIHGKPVEAVHFHEVGAIDSIVDVVGAAIAFDALGVEYVLCGPVELGSGFVKCAHGLMPIPAPATAEILKGVPVISKVQGFEMTTPTGAAIIKATVDAFDKEKHFTIEKIAYGLGQRTLDIPNVFRVMLVSIEKKKSQQWLIETNIDDMTAEHLSYAEEMLFDHGALDVFRTPIVMKKGRAAVKLSVLCKDKDLHQVQKVLVSETSAIGMRIIEVTKLKLERTYQTFESSLGPVTIKQAFFQGERVNEKLEYEDCKALALKHKMPLKSVYEHIQRELLKSREEN